MYVNFHKYFAYKRTLDGLKSRFDPLELHIFSWTFDWSHYRWIWTDWMSGYALPTSSIKGYVGASGTE